MGASGRNIARGALEGLGGHALQDHLGRELLITGHPKVGATAGWIIGAANDGGLMATIPAGVTAGTLVVRLPAIPVGATIRGYRLFGQIESGGNAATVDAILRKITLAAADVVEADVTGSGITQVSVTADAILNASKTGLTEVVATATFYYLLITATTAASTDIALAGVGVTVY